MAGPTERCWLFGTLAVTLARIDFVDPACAGSPEARERGVRVEIRPAQAGTRGSIYASPDLRLAPAVCRIDLLESAPGAADRMHWHPAMGEGEPGDRNFEPTMSADPVAWISDRLHELDLLLERIGTVDVDRHRDSVVAVRESAPEIVEAVREGLAWARAPWPDVRHDERGMAVRTA